ncbi:MAG: prolipoprotein diacylglyceryl transferase [Dehalococcoidia bacterium]|nr:Prolipoprotein diacylglyceryl transferase [Chloroflexota bacterium]MBT9160193.1 Prolipoprotein diacylglyceryl transferase [Chloroflexota bacterium]MBT9162193.1 Prolipoprotein diacylglyceryl transferase [Chloroflexota bacterium]
MIEFGVNPILFAIGPFELRWYGIMIVLAVITGISMTVIMAKREGVGNITRYQIVSIAIWVIPGGIVGSRLLHIIDMWVTTGNPGPLLGGEGATIFGAILGGTLAASIAAWVMGISIGHFANIVALVLPLGQAIGRVGCTLNGCCYGEPTALPWGVVWTHPNSYAYRDTFLAGVAVHPTQVYEIIWNVLFVFAAVWLLRKRLLRRGWTLYLLYISVYSFGRFFITFLRVNEPFLFGLQQAQVVSLLVLAIAIPLLVYLLRKPAPAPLVAAAQQED